MQRLILTVIILFLAATPVIAQPVIFYSGPAGASLDARWNWARDAAEEPAYWIGYRIDRLMNPRAFYGMYMSGSIEREQSMYALIGEPEKFDEVLTETHMNWNFRGDGFFHFRQSGDEKGGDLPVQVMKEIAILAKYERGSRVPVNMAVTNMSMEVNFERTPVYWLDHAAGTESLELIVSLFSSLRDTNVKERTVTAAGIHQDTPGVSEFLASVLFGDEPADVRERAASWLGQQDTPEAFQTLQRVVRDDPSLEVREHAVYAISSMSLPESLDFLIEMARNERNSELREKAIFGLGQRASEKALATLEETIYSDEDTEVQKHAVFALSQFDLDTAVPRLIDIANNHPNVRVRKQAIFWLGDTGDDRAVEALIEIVERQ